ncbi:helix-turn-helix domain-containing protein, partial [Streptomyces sp. NRAIS4]
MGRPETPIDYTIPALGKAAQILRSMRRSANLTYTELAARTNYSPAHLKRVARGQRARSAVFEAYAQACRNGDSDYYLIAEVRYLCSTAAEAIQATKRAAGRSTVVPKPQYASDEADLSRALRDAWTHAGRPACRQIETVTDGQVPRSTASAITNGHTVPRDLRQYVAFLTACEITGDALAVWFRAWTKVRGIPKDEERRLARKWMTEPAIAVLYFTALLNAAQQQLDARARTASRQERSHLRAVVTEALEALYGTPRQTTRRGLADADERLANLLIIDPLA